RTSPCRGWRDNGRRAVPFPGGHRHFRQRPYIEDSSKSPWPANGTCGPNACRLRISLLSIAETESMTLKAEPILPRFGAVCSGIDLTRPLTQEQVDEVTDAMDRWGVCVYRNTGLTDEQHVE